MGSVLVTGASGFIGARLVRELAGSRDVVALSRRDPGVGAPWVQGDFACFEDLRRLDDHEIDAVVHLGAVTGGCSEREGIAVNVAGTRSLLRYLMDRGCRKYVMASSIAAVGLADAGFRPLQLPMADDHPCLAVDGYGVSKYLMEEVLRYFARQEPEADITALRLAAIFPDESPPSLVRPFPACPYAVAAITQMAVSDAVRTLRLALESRRAGLRVLNATHREAWTATPVAEVFRNWWGDSVDLSFYEEPGHMYRSPFSAQAIERELGFVAEHGPERYRP